jgi:hypothetical protein
VAAQHPAAQRCPTHRSTSRLQIPIQTQLPAPAPP